MKHIGIKLAVAPVLLLGTGTLFFVYMRLGDHPSPLVDFILPIVLATAMLLIAVLVVMFLPPDIKSYPLRRKLLIGITASLAGIVLVMAAFLAAAFLVGPLFG